MEILNKNLRENALWRIVGVGFTLLAMLGVVYFTSIRSYAKIGIGNKQQSTLSLSDSILNAKGELGDWEVRVTALYARKTELQKEVDAVRRERNNLNKRLNAKIKELNNLEN